MAHAEARRARRFVKDGKRRYLERVAIEAGRKLNRELARSSQPRSTGILKIYFSKLGLHGFFISNYEFGPTMKPSHVLTLVLLTTSLVTVSSLPARAAEDAPAATAAEATADLFAALAANDVDRAAAMTAPVKGVPPEAVREYYQRMAEHTKKAGTPQVAAHLQLEDAAVVVFREGGSGKGKIVDLDPAYLIRRDGKWLVLFKLTSFDRPYLELDERALANLKRLQEWFDAQKPKLQALLGGGT